jgi:hypothetical protein
MSDSALEAKFSDLAEGIRTAPQIRQLLDTCWGVEKLPGAVRNRTGVRYVDRELVERKKLARRKLSGGPIHSCASLNNLIC